MPKIVFARVENVAAFLSMAEGMWDTQDQGFTDEEARAGALLDRLMCQMEVSMGEGDLSCAIPDDLVDAAKAVISSCEGETGALEFDAASEDEQADHIWPGEVTIA